MSEFKLGNISGDEPLVKAQEDNAALARRKGIAAEE